LIAFGSSISGAEAYRRYAEPGIRRAAEPDSPVLAYAAVEPIGRTYNLILESATALEQLEALVLVHPHTEILDSHFCAKVREVLSDPDVGLLGCAGARGVRSIAWWEAEVVIGRVRQQYEEYRGGEIDSVPWATRHPPPGEVEVLDGQLLVLSPWAVRNVRFDETLLLGHGFDLDYSLRVRDAGRKLVVADLEVTHHRSLELISDLAVWVEAHIEMAEKWDSALNEVPADESGYKRRARRAEARREAARAIAMSESLKLDARVLDLERQFEQKTSTMSWRLTAPLRALNRVRRRLSEGDGASASREAQLESRPWK
jgi:hypothetical protein